MVVAPIPIALERYKAIDFAGYLGGSSCSMLVRYPSTDHILYMATIQPFNYLVGISKFQLCR